MTRNIYYINDGEEWWISAKSSADALRHLAYDIAGYREVDQYIRDHDIDLLNDIKKIDDDEVLPVVDYDKPDSPPEKKTAKQWAEEVTGLVASTCM